MSSNTLIASIWNTALIFIAAASFAYGTGTLGACILGGMIVSAFVAGFAASVADAITRAIPWLSAFAGTFAGVLYWMIRIEVWLN